MSRRTFTAVVDRLRTALGGARGADRADGELLTRFARDRDQDAFAVLVRRYGPLVLGVCRRVLGDPHRADDAFQATFLVLARKAAALGGRPLAGWLSTVAYHAALRVRASDARRRHLEMSAMPPQPPAAEVNASDVGAVLDAELQRLPDKYRLPIVLCCLHGATHAEAAAQLACPVGTVRSRLARGRDLLRARLVRRGLAALAAALAAVLAPAALAVEPTAGLIQATLTQVGDGAASPVAQEVLRTMLVQKLKRAVVAAAAVLAVAGAWLAASFSHATPVPPPEKPRAGVAEEVGVMGPGTIRLPLSEVASASVPYQGDRPRRPRLTIVHVPRGWEAAAAKSFAEGALELVPPHAGGATVAVLDSLLRGGHGEAVSPSTLSRNGNLFTLVVDQWDSHYEYRRNVPAEEATVVPLGDLPQGEYELRVLLRQMSRQGPDGEAHFHMEAQKLASARFAVAAADAKAGAAVSTIAEADFKGVEFPAEEGRRRWQRPEARAYGPWTKDDDGQALGLHVGTFDEAKWRAAFPKAPIAHALSKMLPDLKAPTAAGPVYAMTVGPVMPELHMVTSLREVEWKDSTAVLRVDVWYDGGPNNHNVPVCPVLVAPLSLPTVKDEPGKARPDEYTVQVEWTMLYASRGGDPHKLVAPDEVWVQRFFSRVEARSQKSFKIE